MVAESAHGTIDSTLVFTSPFPVTKNQAVEVPNHWKAADMTAAPSSHNAMFYGGRVEVPSETANWEVPRASVASAHVKRHQCGETLNHAIILPHLEDVNTGPSSHPWVLFPASSHPVRCKCITVTSASEVLLVNSEA